MKINRQLRYGFLATIEKLKLKSDGEGVVADARGTANSRKYKVDILFHNGFEKRNWEVFEYRDQKQNMG